VIKPKIFLMENVRGLLSAKIEAGNITSLLKDEFKRAGYPHVVSQVLCAADYGVPQLRYRVFFMGVRRDISIAPSFPLPTHTRTNYETVDAAIMDLVGKEETVPNHVPMRHNATVSARMRYIPEGAGLPSNGLPKHLSYGSRSDYAHRKLRNFSHIYKRLHRQKPATTMVPGHNAFPLHPTEDRSLTVREAARIQTFDDRIVFAGTRQEQCIQVGNAVPVRLARHLAGHMRSLLRRMASSNE
jgi:DNA (cytosine-5)-methyltransferase 1